MAKGNAGDAAKKAAAEKAAAEAAAKKAAAEKAAAEKAAAEKKAVEEAAAAAAGAKKGTKIVKVPALSVVSSREGFRRGGRAWSKSETVMKLSELGKEQIKQIKEEAVLTVTEIEVDEEVAAE